MAGPFAAGGTGAGVPGGPGRGAGESGPSVDEVIRFASGADGTTLRPQAEHELLLAQASIFRNCLRGQLFVAWTDSRGVRSVTSKEPSRPAGRQAPRSSRHRPAETGAELAAALARLHQQTPLWQSFLAAHRRIVEQLADEMLTEHQVPL